MEKITSRNNEKIKAAVKLVASAEERRAQGLFVLEGARLCKDAFLSGVSMKTIFVTPDALKKYAAELDFLSGINAECFEITNEVAGKISDAATPQGIFCVCKTLDKKSNIDKIKHNGCAEPKKYIALDRIQIPGNLGAVCRTAEALGLDGVIVGGGCDIYNPKALRASMGALLRIPVFVADDLAAFVRDCTRSGMRSYAAVPDADALPVTKADFSGCSLCVVGNEGAGVSAAVAAACSQAITIPMAGRAESLNAAGAAAVIIWEMVR
ncbi:MAG: RNA methyltransferase [Oscillospiraceae bacterium]|jgi:TrmH family RNA methyltransferase|nr:RNA methyltransferase [Oscillospiraceae bacterium]